MARRLPARLSAGRPQLRTHGSTITAELDSVLLHWMIDPAHSEQTITRMTETVTRFAARLEALGVVSFTQVTLEHARGFVMAPLPGGVTPEVHTRHARRTAVRVLFRTLRALGHDVGDPTLDLTLPPRGYTTARPLTDDEALLCRASAQVAPGRGGAMRATAWALGESTAVSSEITRIRVRDLDHPVHPTVVSLPGTKRLRPREVGLSRWGRRVLEDRLRELFDAGADPDTLLAYGGAAPPGGAKAQASVCNALRDVLDSAGLGGETDVRPASLRHWAGRQAFDQGVPIEIIARLLGHRSLDEAAEAIGWDWTATEVA